jgi:transcriptional regulator with XRE-family HTH domain
MSKKEISLLPKLHRSLERLGENIRLARLRRKLSTTMVAERANITRITLANIEKGHPGVSIGHITTVLFVLGLHKDLEQVAQDDVFGRKLQDADIEPKSRAPRRKQ